MAPVSPCIDLPERYSSRHGTAQINIGNHRPNKGDFSNLQQPNGCKGRVPQEPQPRPGLQRILRVLCGVLGWRWMQIHQVLELPY